MELQTAIEILEYHQEWRLGKREDMIHEPKKLTEALDIVLNEVKKFRLDVSSSFSKVVIKNDNGILKTLKDTSIIPRKNSQLHIDDKIYQVLSNVFNYNERTIYVWVGCGY